jgi:cation-dependent mannose-6-phosphate receptor
LRRKEYTISLPNDGNISINVCKSLTHEVWNARVLNPQDIGASVQRKNSHGDFSLGYVNTTLQVKDGMPVLVYEKGTHCPDSENMRGSAIIRFICDKDVYGAGQSFFAAYAV